MSFAFDAKKKKKKKRREENDACCTTMHLFPFSNSLWTKRMMEKKNRYVYKIYKNLSSPASTDAGVVTIYTVGISFSVYSSFYSF